MHFGSKIDKNSKQREEYYTVKEIISPELIKLNNGITVRLIGIKHKSSTNGDAIEFLRLKTKNQKVFLRFDETKHDTENNLYCYLYLKNKTFINAHLIKKGLAEVDVDSDYRLKNKFLKLEESWRKSG